MSEETKPQELFSEVDVIVGAIMSRRFYRVVAETGLVAVESIFGDKDHLAGFRCVVSAYERFGEVDLRNVAIQSDDLRSRLQPYLEKAKTSVVNKLYDKFIDPVQLDRIESMFRKWAEARIIERRETWRIKALEDLSKDVQLGDLAKIEAGARRLVEMSVRMGHYSKAKTPNSMFSDYMKTKDEMLEDKILCGMESVDEAINFLPGNIWTILGVPGRGKTTLLNQIVVNQLLHYHEYSGMYFNLEMSAEEVAAGMIGYVASHDCTPDKARTILKKMRLKFHSDMRDVNDISYAVRMEKEINPSLKFVYIDYAQRVKDRSIKGEGIFERMTAVTEKLTDLCKDLVLFMIILSQPDKESGQSKRLSMYSIKGGGELVQSSSYVCMINPISTGEENERFRSFKGALELDFGKARFSRPSKVPVVFFGESGSFLEFDNQGFPYRKSPVYKFLPNKKEGVGE